MKEAVVDKSVTVAIRDVDIPVVKPGQVLIKVVVSGTNPKDWKVPTWQPDAPAANQGDDIAGNVEAVGEGVSDFRKGDRVAALHESFTAGGSYAEYAIAWAHTTFHLPEETSFEAVGAFAIKLARLSNIHLIIAVAGKGASYVETLIDRSKGDTIIDYREGDEALRKNIKAAAGGLPIHHAYDAVSEKGSYRNLRAVLTAPAKVTVVLPGINSKEVPEEVQLSMTNVGSVHQPAAAGQTVGNAEFGAAFFAFFGRGLAQGWFAGHPHKVRPNGLAGLEEALQDLQAGNASATKYVVRIADTPGL
ncbi:chaperonin 10-like protein [Aspergillus transmontanensis]|uniref:Chaperonin 10-like protein n=1 Tax=Aspergillus transmontanensis TaxID=1034304 RepID=A0A5N6VRD9_9EURO|nr:chaperonin 10-like protein [Aspergillus transmontanensis]